PALMRTLYQLAGPGKQAQRAPGLGVIAAVQLLGPVGDAVALVVVDTRHVEELGHERVAVLAHAAVDFHVWHGRAGLVERALPRRPGPTRRAAPGPVAVQAEGAAVHVPRAGGRRL